MSKYWKYHLGLVGQILAASGIYGAFVAALTYYKPAPAWQDNPAHAAWVLGWMSAAMALALGLIILASFVIKDKLAERRNNS